MKNKLVILVILFIGIQGIVKTDPGGSFTTCMVDSDCLIPGLRCVDSYCVTPLDERFEYMDFFDQRYTEIAFEPCPNAVLPNGQIQVQLVVFEVTVYGTGCWGNGWLHCIPEYYHYKHECYRDGLCDGIAYE